MPQKAGDGLGISTIIQDIHCKGVAGTMPTNMFIGASTFYPSFNRFAATLI